MLYKYIRTFGNLLHCIWPYSLSQRFSRYYAWFYTAWIAHNVRKIGLHTEVEPGLYLDWGLLSYRPQFPYHGS